MYTLLQSANAIFISLAMTIGLGSIAWGADTMNMVLIPGGEFTMGSMNHSDEQSHNVVLDAYHIDTYEVSNAHYRDFMRATNHPAPAYWDDPRLNLPAQPVVGVNWHDATAYCQWTGKRLPTEAEWEHAAKGPEGSHFPWGNTIDHSRANYGQEKGKTMPVDSYPNGVSGYGVYNMAGNVFEWMNDWYDPHYFRVSPALNPQGPDDGYNFANQGPVKVLKGGSWLAPETSLHSSHRFWNQPENNSYGVGLGFRCAMSAAREDSSVVQHDFMGALISMGKEQWNEALQSIDRAIHHNPGNKEYQQTRMIIMRQIQK